MSDFHQAVFFDQVPDSLKAAKYISTDIYPIIKMKVGAWREEARLSDVCVSVQVPTASSLHLGLNKLFKKGDVWALFGTSDRFLKLNGNEELSTFGRFFGRVFGAAESL